MSYHSHLLCPIVFTHGIRSLDSGELISLNALGSQSHLSRVLYQVDPLCLQRPAYAQDFLRRSSPSIFTSRRASKAP